MHPPDMNYARSGEVAIAYQVVAEGPTDVVFVRGITGDLLSTSPELVVASTARKRGHGHSDPRYSAGRLLQAL